MNNTSVKILKDPDLGDVTFRKSAGSGRVSIRVHPVKGVSVTVPFIVPYAVAEAFYNARRQWILETVAKQKERYRDMPEASAEQVEAMRSQAKAELPGRLAELAARYAFLYNRVTIKHNATNWGSCSAKGNINLNLNIVRLPRPLQDYVLLHELCHLRHHDHGHGFHLLLEHVCTDNLIRLMDEGDTVAAALARKAAASRAKYPMDHIMTAEIKKYGIV